MRHLVLGGVLWSSLVFLPACSGLPVSPPENPAGVTPAGAETTASVEAAPVAAAAESKDPSPDSVSASKKDPHEYEDLWDRIRAGYGLPELDSPYIARHEKWFASNPQYMERLVQRARLYLYYIVEQVEKRGFPTEIALLPAIESAFKPHAYSRARAVGLWQFIPSTGRRYGLKRDWWYDGRRDVIAATQAALNYLDKLHREFDGDWHLALAAYNAGEGRVARARAHNLKRGLPADYEHLRRLKAETRNYVPKLIAFARVVADPEKYGIELPPIPNKPYFTVVETASQVDLGVVAKASRIHIGDLYDINPGFKRWATAPTGPHRLLVPVDKHEAVAATLASLPEKDRMRWKRHHIRHGETLSSISRRYGVSVASIKRANRIRGTRIRAGRDLIIPISDRRISTRVARVNRPLQRRPAPPPKGHVAVVHRVQAGDTLWDLAQKYGVYVGQIARWNLISRRSVLRLGQPLKIWVPPERAPTATPAG